MDLRRGRRSSSERMDASTYNEPFSPYTTAWTPQSSISSPSSYFATFASKSQCPSPASSDRHSPLQRKDSFGRRMLFNRRSSYDWYNDDDYIPPRHSSEPQTRDVIQSSDGKKKKSKGVLRAISSLPRISSRSPSRLDSHMMDRRGSALALPADASDINYDWNHEIQATYSPPGENEGNWADTEIWKKRQLPDKVLKHYVGLTDEVKESQRSLEEESEHNFINRSLSTGNNNLRGYSASLSKNARFSSLMPFPSLFVQPPSRPTSRDGSGLSPPRRSTSHRTNAGWSDDIPSDVVDANSQKPKRPSTAPPPPIHEITFCQPTLSRQSSLEELNVEPSQDYSQSPRFASEKHNRRPSTQSILFEKAVVVPLTPVSLTPVSLTPVSRRCVSVTERPTKSESPKCELLSDYDLAKPKQKDGLPLNVESGSPQTTISFPRLSGARSGDPNKLLVAPTRRTHMRSNPSTDTFGRSTKDGLLPVSENDSLELEALLKRKALENEQMNGPEPDPSSNPPSEDSNLSSQSNPRKIPSTTALNVQRETVVVSSPKSPYNAEKFGELNLDVDAAIAKKASVENYNTSIRCPPGDSSSLDSIPPTSYSLVSSPTSSFSITSPKHMRRTSSVMSTTTSSAEEVIVALKNALSDSERQRWTLEKENIRLRRQSQLYTIINLLQEHNDKLIEENLKLKSENAKLKTSRTNFDVETPAFVYRMPS